MPLRETVLVVDPDPRAREDLATLIESDGRLAIVARDAEEAAERVKEAPPHLVLVDAGAGNGRLGLELLRSLRAAPSARAVPVTVLVDPDQRETLLEAFDLGADDVVARDTDRRELAARLRARLERPPLPREEHARDPATGALKAEALRRDLQLEVERTARGSSSGCLAYVSLHELPALEAAHGPRARAEVLTQLVALIEADGRRLDLVGLSRGTLALLLPGTPAKGGQARLERLSRKIYEHDFALAGQTVRFTPAVG